MAKATKQLKLKLVRSTAGRLAAHKACIKGLGLRRMHHEVTVTATPEVLGMVNKVSYLLAVEEV